MYGAILGDMIGAPYEFDRGNKTKDFEMFNDRVCFTDDSVMTIAVADALMRISNDADDDDVKTAVIQSMQKWGKKYPRAGYGLLAGQEKPTAIRQLGEWIGNEGLIGGLVV